VSAKNKSGLEVEKMTHDKKPVHERNVDQEGSSSSAISIPSSESKEFTGNEYRRDSKTIVERIISEKSWSQTTDQSQPTEMHQFDLPTGGDMLSPSDMTRTGSPMITVSSTTDQEPLFHQDASIEVKDERVVVGLTSPVFSRPRRVIRRKSSTGITENVEPEIQSEIEIIRETLPDGRVLERRIVRAFRRRKVVKRVTTQDRQLSLSPMSSPLPQSTSPRDPAGSTSGFFRLSPRRILAKSVLPVTEEKDLSGLTEHDSGATATAVDDPFIEGFTCTQDDNNEWDLVPMTASQISTASTEMSDSMTLTGSEIFHLSSTASEGTTAQMTVIDEGDSRISTDQSLSETSASSEHYTSDRPRRELMRDTRELAFGTDEDSDVEVLIRGIRDEEDEGWQVLSLDSPVLGRPFYSECT